MNERRCLIGAAYPKPCVPRKEDAATWSSHLHSSKVETLDRNYKGRKVRRTINWICMFWSSIFGVTQSQTQRAIIAWKWSLGSTHSENGSVHDLILLQKMTSPLEINNDGKTRTLPKEQLTAKSLNFFCFLRVLLLKKKSEFRQNLMNGWIWFLKALFMVHKIVFIWW